MDQADYNDGNSDIDDWSYILRSPIHTLIISRQRLVEVSLSSGNYSRLLADVIFTRSMGYYMIQVIWGILGYQILQVVLEYFRILNDTSDFGIF